MKTIKLPKSIIVLGRAFEIREVDEVRVNGKIASGSFCFENRIIEIESDLDIQQKMGLLAHEVGHAGLVIFGLDQRLSSKEIEIFCQLIRALIEDYIKAFK